MMTDQEFLEALLAPPPEMDEAALAANFQLQHITPEHAPELAFTLRVPNGWEPTHPPGSAAQELGYDEPLHLAAWQDPAYRNAPMLFSMSAVLIGRDITAKHFLVHYAISTGQKLVASREISDVRVDAVLEKQLRGATFLERLTVFFDGPRARFVSGTAHVSDVQRYAPVWATMLQSTKIERPFERRTVEEWRRHVVLDRLAFRAPRSFRARAALDGTDTHAGFELFQKDVEGRFSGYLSVDLNLGVPIPELESEIEEIALHLRARGIELERTVDPVEFGGGSDALTKRGLYVFHGTNPDGVPVEAWFASLALSGHPIRVWNLGPSREASVLHWGQNQRALRAALGTLEALPAVSLRED